MTHAFKKCKGQFPLRPRGQNVRGETEILISFQKER